MEILRSIIVAIGGELRWWNYSRRYIFARAIDIFINDLLYEIYEQTYGILNNTTTPQQRRNTHSGSNMLLFSTYY